MCCLASIGVHCILNTQLSLRPSQRSAAEALILQQKQCSSKGLGTHNNRAQQQSMSLAAARLAQERKAWRKDKPFGFIAKPDQAPDVSVNIKKWKCYIPGKDDTPWAGGLYPLELHFADSYPDTPPECRFPAGFFHPNVYPTGKVCLSILNPQPHGSWKTTITLAQILVGIQELLDTPNCHSPAQMPAYQSYTKERAAYTQLIRKQAAKYPPLD